VLLCWNGIATDAGHFVVKAFDMYTDFSAGLMYLIYQNFEEVAVFKPNTSRQANSERFLVCKGLRCVDPPAAKYLLEINDKLNAMKDDGGKQHEGTSLDVLSIVPREMMQADKGFIGFFTNANNSVGWKQVRALKKLHNFIRDPTLPGEDRSVRPLRT
jgi:cap1 methyltransferase